MVRLVWEAKFRIESSLFPFPITEIVEKAKELERKGKEIIALHIGGPPQYGFNTPQIAIEALTKAVKNGFNFYSQPEGEIELRKAIIKRIKKLQGINVSLENIFIVQGSSEGINLLVGSLLDPGDEALIPEAWYSLHNNCTRLYNGKPVTYQLIEDTGWLPSIDDVRKKFTNRTRFILLNNPNNPTGVHYPEKTIKEILDIAAENSVLVIADEIYKDIIFEGEFKHAASLTKDVCVIVSDGFSKSYSMTGWRLGWFYIVDPTGKYEGGLRDYITNLARTRMCPNIPMQRAGIVVMKELSSQIPWLEKLRA